MSFTRAEFDAGFARPDVSRSSISRRFYNMILAHGEDITIIKRTKVTETDYGEPTWSEDERSTHALVSRAGSMDAKGAGDLPKCDVKLHVSRWENIDESGVFEVEIDGERYHVKSVITTEAYKMALLDRRIDA